jgi:glycosyltransferase involved in cell wall biosynthesis
VTSKRLLRTSGVGRAAREVWLRALIIEGRLRARPNRSNGEPRDRLRILACSPTYLPAHRRGAEVTLHAVLTELHQRGHEIRILADAGGVSGSIDGIDVLAGVDHATAFRQGQWADIIVGQLTARWQALCVAARARRPSVYFMHVGNVPRRALYGRPDLTVFNSEHLRDEYPWIKESIVVHPPVLESDYLATPGDAVTLVNLTEPKGAHVFYELARRLPEHQFLGVKGTGPQEIPNALPANVSILEHAADMRAVYRRTRILLVPSVYESYGRVALEAAVSGIPTIGQPTPGMLEAMEGAATWMDRTNLDAWAERIEQLDDPAEYARASQVARAQFDQLDPGRELDELERALVELTRNRTR